MPCVFLTELAGGTLNLQFFAKTYPPLATPILRLGATWRNSSRSARGNFAKGARGGGLAMLAILEKFNRHTDR